MVTPFVRQANPKSLQMEKPFIDELRELKQLTPIFAKYYVGLNYHQTIPLIDFLIKTPFAFQAAIWVDFAHLHNYGIEVFTRTYNIYYIDDTGIPDFLIEHRDDTGVAYLSYGKFEPTITSRELILQIAIMTALQCINAQLNSDTK